MARIGLCYLDCMIAHIYRIMTVMICICSMYVSMILHAHGQSIHMRHAAADLIIMIVVVIIMINHLIALPKQQQLQQQYLTTR